jgi:thioredoxin reductase
MGTVWDCAIIGGGPAGMNAALVLGRARRNVVLFDDNRPRNAVTHEAHGFITRDGIKPDEFRKIGVEELGRYPSVQIHPARVTEVESKGGAFGITTADGGRLQARKLILATGLKEELPAVEGLRECYGKSVFSCPYCDGWERRDQPLLIISETEHAFDMVKSVYQWSRDLILCTNGYYVISREDRKTLAAKNVKLYEQKIKTLQSDRGQLRKVIFDDGSVENRTGGFISPVWSHSGNLARSLTLEWNSHGGIASDDFGRTSMEGVYAAGDASNIVPAQLVVAAAGGARAAIGVNTELMSEEF